MAEIIDPFKSPEIIDPFKGGEVPLSAPAPSWGATAIDAAKQLGAGLAVGVESIPGAIPSAMLAAGRGVESMWRGLGLETPEQAEEIRQRESRLAAIQKVREEGMTPPLATIMPKPETKLGEYARTVGEFAPAAAVGPGGLLRRAVTQDIIPAVTSETAGQVTKGTPLEPAARVAGAVVGGVGAIGTAKALEAATSPAMNVGTDLARAITRDGDTPEALMGRLAQARQIRPDATVADVGGENVRGLVERVAQTPGAGRTIVTPALTGRQQAQAMRLSNDLTALTGTRQSAFEATKQTMAARKADAKPLWDIALDFNARSDSDIVTAWQKATNTGWGKSILNSPELRQNLQSEYGIQNVGDAPLMVQIDQWKKAADDIIGNALRNNNKNTARVISKARDDVLGVVKEKNPAYQEALNAWAGPSQYLDAIEQGRGILSKNISAEELAANIAEMTEAQREGYRIGAVSAIRGKMGSDTAKLGDMTKYLRSNEMRAKLSAIMPTPEAAENFARSLDYEIRSSELTGRALGNSATARRLAEKFDADSIVGDLVMGAFAHGPTMGLLRQTLMTIPNRVRDTLRSRSDALLADILVNPRLSPQTAQLMPQVRRAIATPRGSGVSPLLPAVYGGPGWLTDAQGNTYPRAKGGSVPFHPSSIGARQAKDGHWYAEIPHARGRYMRVVAHG